MSNDSERIESLEKENAQLSNKLTEYRELLKLSEGAKEAYKASSNAYHEELEGLHEVLDALPGHIDRRARGSCRDRSVLTRLAAWLGATK